MGARLEPHSSAGKAESLARPPPTKLLRRVQPVRDTRTSVSSSVRVVSRSQLEESCSSYFEMFKLTKQLRVQYPGSLHEPFLLFIRVVPLNRSLLKINFKFVSVF